MEKKIERFILEHNLNIDNVVICATSGGADSLAMLHILYKLGYKVVLAHVNHHKRVESKAEAKAMESLAIKLNIPFELLDYHFDGKGNFHDASHNARYDFFRGLCDKYHTDIIATAHQLDDQIETILIKLMEGSNLYGYGGISVVNNDGNYRIIRPLLCVSKSDLYDYCKNNNIIYYEDSSNQEDDFLRNRLRHHVVPLLKKECPDLYDKALRYSLLMHESFDYIRKDSIAYLKENNDSIVLSSFNELDIALKKDIISLLLENSNVRRNTNIINDILQFLTSSEGTKSIDLENDIVLIRSYGVAKLKRKQLSNTDEVILNVSEKVIYADKYLFYLDKKVPECNAKYIKLCYNELTMPLHIRSKNDGDNIVISNGTKKISRVFVDKKVPKDERSLVPVIFDNNGKALWIYDYLKSDDVSRMKANGDIYLICEVIKNGN